MLAGLRHQRERSRDGDVGQNVRGVFQTQTIFDQTGLSRLPNDFVKNLLKAFGAKPRAELGSETWFGQGRLDRQIEKEAERDIDLRLTNDALVGQPVVKLQQEQFEQADGINRAAPHIRRVTWGNKRAYGVEIHGGLETPQIMIRRHELLEDQVVKRCQDDVIVIFEHHVLSRSIRGAVTVHRLPGDGNLLSDLFQGAGSWCGVSGGYARAPPPANFRCASGAKTCGITNGGSDLAPPEATTFGGARSLPLPVPYRAPESDRVLKITLFYVARISSPTTWRRSRKLCNQPVRRPARSHARHFESYRSRRPKPASAMLSKALQRR